MSLTRTQISLSDEDRQVLDHVSRRTGRSMSALIREAIQATYKSSPTTDEVLAALDATYGVVDIDEDGAASVESIRSGRRLADLQ